jgi:hypothetical protein
MDCNFNSQNHVLGISVRLRLPVLLFRRRFLLKNVVNCSAPEDDVISGRQVSGTQHFRQASRQRSLWFWFRFGIRRCGAFKYFDQVGRHGGVVHGAKVMMGLTTNGNITIMGVSKFTMLDTPFPIRTLKLSNSGPGY